MSIVAGVQRALEKEEDKVFANSTEYLELKRFYKRMQELGLVVKREYGLGEIDTVGRELNTLSVSMWDFPSEELSGSPRPDPL